MAKQVAKKSSPEGASSVGRATPREKPQQVADELRRLILNGDLSEGESLGRETDLVERFGVSRPTLREGLRILEAEGLIAVIRGALGGVVVHRPDQRVTARAAALVLQSRSVSLLDVHEARAIIEPAAVRIVASSPGHGRAARRVRTLVAAQQRAIDDPVAFSRANERLHEELVVLAGNQTLTIVAEMLNEIVARAITSVADNVRRESPATRRRSIRSQEKLALLIQVGDAHAAEEHWRTHMAAVRGMLLGPRSNAVIDTMDHH